MDLSSASTRSAPPVTRALLLATALVAGSACVAPTEATQSAWTISVVKSGSTSASEEWFPEPLVLVEANRVQVTGWLRTPLICDDVSPIVFATATRISIRLVHTRRAGGCVLAVGEHTYVVAGTLRPGTYDLEVVVDSRAPMPVPTATLNTRVRID